MTYMGPDLLSTVRTSSLRGIFASWAQLFDIPREHDALPLLRLIPSTQLLSVSCFYDTTTTFYFYHYVLLNVFFLLLLYNYHSYSPTTPTPQCLLPASTIQLPLFISTTTPQCLLPASTVQLPRLLSTTSPPAPSAAATYHEQNQTEYSSLSYLLKTGYS